jgi:2-phospho-L-lactate guanylyltransferase
MAEPGGDPGRYGVVVPVKPAAVAKSRLSSLGDEVRRELVTAFAVDTIVAARACAAVGEVVAVTGDPGLTDELAELGVTTFADRFDGRLNESLTYGAAALLALRPDLRPLALCGDLPALRPDDLAATLGAAPDDRAGFVPDASGSGTTLYTSPSLVTFRPRFGHSSRSAHLASGAVELGTPPSGTVRLDVDTPDDLRRALALGVGSRTSEIAARLGLATGPGE